MTIDEVIAKQTEALRDEVVIGYIQAHYFVQETVNAVLLSLREEALDGLKKATERHTR